MADPHTIEDCLSQFAANWSKNQTWKDASWQTWSGEFQFTPNSELRSAIKKLIREESSSFAPPIGQVIDYVKVECGGDSHEDLAVPDPCHHCRISGTPKKQQTGMRQVSIHYEKTPQRFVFDTGKPSVKIFAVRCTCEFGLSRNLGVATLDDFLEKYEKTNRVFPDRIREIHVTLRGEGTLSRRQRMLEEDYVKWLDRPKNPKTDQLLRRLQDPNSGEFAER